MKVSLLNRVRAPRCAGAREFDPDPHRWPEMNDPLSDVPNCYAWALDYSKENSLPPGMLGARLSSQPFASGLALTPLVLRQALLADGLSLAKAPVCDGGAGWLAALFLGPSNGQFHFVRGDADGSWSHKPGAHRGSTLKQISTRWIALDGDRYTFDSWWWVDPAQVTDNY